MDYTRYQGFLPTNRRLLETLKPGETTLFRDTKLGQAGQGVVYKVSSSSFFLSPFETTTTRTQNNVSPEDYVVPNKKGVMATRPARHLPAKRFIAKSTYSDSYVNYDNIVSTIKDCNSSSTSLHIFNRFSNNGTHITSDQLLPLLREIMQQQAAPSVINQILALLNATDKIAFTHSDILSAMDKIKEVIRSHSHSQLGQHYVPAWMRSDSIAPSVVRREPFASSCQIDMGTYGENPRNRGVSFMEKTGVQGTTQDLFRGTAKASIHIPGYKGFIPTSKPADFADKQFHRPSSGELKMTYKPTVPGYTGHYQKEAETISIPHATKSTTSGASQMAIRKVWSKRGINLT